MDRQQLSHYTIVSKIGQGGMGAVYRAVDTRLNRTVALKVLPPQASADPDRKRRFVQEAQSASALNYPNIVNIYEIDCVDGIDFIAMEYVDGEALDKIIDRAPLAIDVAIEYALQMAAALAAAHDAGIVHRDVKPANTLVSRTGLVKVLDFGLAKLIFPDTAGAFAATQTATPGSASGLIIGTAAYMSPEQAEGLPVDARTDVFSFGAVVYEMLTGRRAFQGRSPLSIIAAVLHEHPSAVGQLRADVPASLERIVDRCLEKDPQKRYANAREMLTDLQACRAPAPATPELRRRGWSLPVIRPRRHPRDLGGGEPDSAFRLLGRVQAIIPDDPQFARVLNNVTDPAAVKTDPPGVEVSRNPT